MNHTFPNIKEREESLLCRTYARYPISTISGKGSRLWDKENNEYIDLLAGIAVTALGHCNDEIADCIREQSLKLIHVSNLFYQEEQLDLAQNLLATTHLSKVFFCNSGAEANEAAIKIARRYMQKVKNRQAFEVITLEGAFHGRTLATLGATGQAKFQNGFEPIPQGFKQVAWNDLAALEAAITPQTAAVLVEIIQGEGGIRPMPEEYAMGIQQLCAKHDILFMVDEIQCGMGRTGVWWSFQHFGLKPDVFTVAKGLANGLPMGAMICSNEVAKAFECGSHATTFGGGALVSAVAKEVLAIIERDHLHEYAKEQGALFMDQARVLQKKYPQFIADVRGKGFMIGIALKEDAPKTPKAIWDRLLEKRFILNLAQGKILRLLPALTIEKADLDLFLKELEAVFQE